MVRFLLLFTAAFIWQYSLSQCQYSINAYDSFGDGWNGGQLDVHLNGTPVAGSPFSLLDPPGDADVFMFTTNTSDSLSVTWTPGQYNGEVSFEVVDSEGSILYASGSGPTTGVNYTGFTNCPTCPAPSNFMISGVTIDSAIFGWDAAGAANFYNLEWGPTGFSPGMGTETGSTIGTANTGDTAAMLSSQTDYDVYIRSDCGTLGSWSGPFSFTTLCSPELAPWFETFTGTMIPNCWSQSQTSGDGWRFQGNPGWDANGTLDHTNGDAENYAWIDYSATDVGVILELPEVDVAALVTAQLNFWIWSHSPSNTVDPYNVTIVEAWDGLNWNHLDSIQGDFGPDWHKIGVVIDSSHYYNGTIVKLRLRGESGGNSGNDYYNDILVDDVSIEEAPPCLAVSNLAVLDAGTTDAIIGWTNGDAELQWGIEYGAVGFVQGTGTLSTSTQNPDTLLGLSPDTFYEVYVQAHCGLDSSDWIGPVSFNTFNQGQFMEAGTACGPGFIDISSTGTNLMLTDDSEAGVILPFPWLFQNTLVEEITVGNNGGVHVGTTTGNVSSVMNQNGLYPFVQDLDNDINGVDQEGVFVGVDGVAPNRRFIVMWKDRTHYSGNSNPDPCTFELIYEEGTNEVYYVYPDVDFSNSNYDFGQDAEIGVVGPVNDIEVSINSSAYLQQNDCVHLYYTDCPKPKDLGVIYVTTDEASIDWLAGLSGETAWTVVYGPVGFDPMTSGTTQTTTTPDITLVGLEQLTEYDVYVYADCSPSVQSVHLLGSFTTAPLCSDPFNINATGATDSLLSSWSWTELNATYPATGFNIVYGNVDFDPSSEGTLVMSDTVMADTVVDASFISGSVYEVYIQAVCDTLSSNLVGPINFTMPLTNDSVCYAEPLNVDGSVYVFNNSGATVSTGEAAIAPPNTGNQSTDGWGNTNISFSTWFSFEAPASGQMRLNCRDVGFDGQLAVYDALDCSDFGTFTLVGANDRAIEGGSNAPNFTLCGLIPGHTYLLMHDSRSSFSTGTYSISLSEVIVSAGQSNGVVTVCSGDTVDLSTTVFGQDQGGTWYDNDNTFHLVNDNMFTTSGLAYEVYEFDYEVVDGCVSDAVTAQVEVFSPSMAGDNGSLTICLNQPIGLFSGLSGTITTGGTWYDSQDNPIAGSDILAGALSLPGTYNYDYIVSNGVCPADSGTVTITVDNNCDFLSLEELTGNSIEVFPNPTNDVVTVVGDLDGTYDITVEDMTGKVIMTKHNLSFKNEQSFSLRDVENGIYLFRINQENKEKVIKVVKN